MTAIQDLRPPHRPGASQRSMSALRAALRALRDIHDEQMRMWEPFYRISTRDARPEVPPQDSTAGPNKSPAADVSGDRAA